ncbi:MAG TPA: FG-GAP-like repeat-containing protein [Candidatus Eisenbacteria bacterium]|nr:FG-GAP-like repeat-containing protein [Candidatus Eisenbacteria bacterium]
MRRRNVIGCRIPRQARSARGFTLVELMITLTVLAAVMIVLMTVMYAASRSKTSTSNRVESDQSARVAMDMLVRDLRSAGYGADMDYTTQPQPPIAYIDSLQVLLNANMAPFPDSLPGLLPSWPQAYSPVGFPRPYPLNGTAWQPPIRYRGGAETVRWTLDVNNDGKSDSLDWTAFNGLDAQRTPNRSDYVLVRQVYGDSTNAIVNWNGGTTERVALINRPTSNGAPPLFRVYMAGSSTPWDWSAGPVPASQLANINRVVVSVQGGSSKPDSKGRYATANLSTTVNLTRNVPNFGAALYAISGYVFNDNIVKNGVRDAGEPGISGGTLWLNNGLSTVTDPTGYYILKVPAGAYTLKHLAPPGYGIFTSPDSFNVTVGPAVTRSFADTARAGGWVTSYTFKDNNGNGVNDSGDSVLALIKVTTNPGNDAQYTNSSGYATNFAPVGSYTVTATAPDSFASTTTNPVTGTMAAGGTAAYSFGFKKSAFGTVTGKVFTDNNRNGTLDTGETGIQGVWVGVTPDAGLNVAGWEYTDALGDFSIDAPAVSSPSAPYYIMTVVKPGFFPTSSTTIGPFYLNAGQVITGNNFGEVGYQVITLTASRVLSLASQDVIEKDWNGNHTENAHGDQDLILGSDASGSDQLSVWFNDYNNSPLFNATPTYTRTAQGSVMSMAVDTLDNTTTWKNRPDVATGTRNATGGNFFVWLGQNSSGNEGYVPTTANLSYRTQDMGDVQSILSYDCAGGAMPDLIVGTKSPTANQGTIEVWQNNDAATPAFTRQEIYPPNGSIPSNALGEVTAMALADFDGDGNRDLVVGTTNGTYSGQLLFFKYVSKTNGNRFVYQCGYSLPGDAVTSLAAFDIDGDGMKDVAVGTQRNTTAGHLQQWGNKYSSPTWGFALDREVNAPGIVISLATADFGGSVRGDLAVGFRADLSSYVGGVRVYFCDTNRIPSTGSDPSAGSVTNMVPAITTNNFNYGTNPVASGTQLKDLATGVKITSTTGALVVYIR